MLSTGFRHTAHARELGGYRTCAVKKLVRLNLRDTMPRMAASSGWVPLSNPFFFLPVLDDLWRE